MYTSKRSLLLLFCFNTYDRVDRTPDRANVEKVASFPLHRLITVGRILSI